MRDHDFLRPLFAYNGFLRLSRDHNFIICLFNLLQIHTFITLFLLIYVQFCFYCNFSQSFNSFHCILIPYIYHFSNYHDAFLLLYLFFQIFPSLTFILLNILSICFFNLSSFCLYSYTFYLCLFADLSLCHISYLTARFTQQILYSASVFQYFFILYKAIPLILLLPSLFHPK